MVCSMPCGIMPRGLPRSVGIKADTACPEAPTVGSTVVLAAAPPPTTVLDLTRFVCATRSRKRRSSSLSSARDCWICSGVRRFKSAVRRRKTCLPMQLEPTNFLLMRIGSQLSSLERKVRRVVPSVKGNKPALNS